MSGIHFTINLNNYVQSDNSTFTLYLNLTTACTHNQQQPTQENTTDKDANPSSLANEPATTSTPLLPLQSAPTVANCSISKTIDLSSSNHDDGCNLPGLIIPNVDALNNQKTMLTTAANFPTAPSYEAVSSPSVASLHAFTSPAVASLEAVTSPAVASIEAIASPIVAYQNMTNFQGVHIIYVTDDEDFFNYGRSDLETTETREEIVAEVLRGIEESGNFKSSAIKRQFSTGFAAENADDADDEIDDDEYIQAPDTLDVWNILDIHGKNYIKNKSVN